MTIHSPPHLMSEHIKPRRRQLYEGTTKTLYEGPEAGTHVLYFKDGKKAKNGKAPFYGKGSLNNRISEMVMARLNDLGINTHLIRILNMHEQLVRSAEILPFRVTVHNVAFGTFAKRLGLPEGGLLPKPIPEFSLRSKELDNPIVAAEHLASLGWGRYEDIDEICLASQRVNDFLNGQFLAINMRLVSFTLEFGRLHSSDALDGSLVITDEISPETCYLVDLQTGKHLNQEIILENPQEARKVYREIACRLGIIGPELQNLPPFSQESRLTTKQILQSVISPRKQKPHGHNIP